MLLCRIALEQLIGKKLYWLHILAKILQLIIHNKYFENSIAKIQKGEDLNIHRKRTREAKTEAMRLTNLGDESYADEA